MIDDMYTAEIIKSSRSSSLQSLRKKIVNLQRSKRCFVRPENSIITTNSQENNQQNVEESEKSENEQIEINIRCEENDVLEISDNDSESNNVDYSENHEELNENMENIRILNEERESRDECVNTPENEKSEDKLNSINVRYYKPKTSRSKRLIEAQEHRTLYCRYL